MNFVLLDFAGKGAYLSQRLRAVGHTQTEHLDESTDVLIVDCDWRWARPRPELIGAAADHGVAVVVYPHAGLPTSFIYDGLTEPDPRVALRLEHGIGSIEMTRMFGGDLDQHATGWLFSPTTPFQPVEDPKSVLFAPLHPNIEAMQRGMNGNGHDPAPAINQRVYRELLATGLDITVSLVGPPHRNGIWPHPRATFIDNPAMNYTHSYTLIQAADVVVASGTMLAAAVSCGKPTVGFGRTDCGDYIDGRYQYAEHAEDYREMADFPLDCTDGELAAKLDRACWPVDHAREWRERWVGDDGTEAAIRLIEGVSLPIQANTKSVNIEGATATVKLTAG